MEKIQSSVTSITFSIYAPMVLACVVFTQKHIFSQANLSFNYIILYINIKSYCISSE